MRMAPVFHTELHPAMLVVLACGLMVFALAAVATVFIAGGKWRFALAGAWPLVVSLLWIIPAVAVLSIIAIRGAKHFQESRRFAHAAAIAAENRPVELLVPRSMQTTPPAWVGKSETRVPATHDLDQHRFVHGDDHGNDQTAQSVTSFTGLQIALSSERWVTLEEAEQQVTASVVQRVMAHFHEEYPQGVSWSAPVALIDKYAVRECVGESLDKDFGNGLTQKMYRVHVLLELSPAVRQTLYASWRGQVVDRRLQVLGGLFGLVTLMLATSAGYFRLDDLSVGKYRGRLRLAAASLITAGTLIVVQIVS